MESQLNILSWFRLLLNSWAISFLVITRQLFKMSLNLEGWQLEMLVEKFGQFIEIISSVLRQCPISYLLNRMNITESEFNSFLKNALLTFFLIGYIKFMFWFARRFYGSA